MSWPALSFYPFSSPPVRISSISAAKAKPSLIGCGTGQFIAYLITHIFFSDRAKLMTIYSLVDLVVSFSYVFRIFLQIDRPPHRLKRETYQQLLEISVSRSIRPKNFFFFNWADSICSH
jgi:hypothetical protein